MHEGASIVEHDTPASTMVFQLQSYMRASSISARWGNVMYLNGVAALFKEDHRDSRISAERIPAPLMKVVAYLGKHRSLCPCTCHVPMAGYRGGIGDGKVNRGAWENLSL